MKKIVLLIFSVLLSVTVLAQTSKILNSVAGNLSTLLSNSDRSSISNLTITGTIDARDFKTMRDSMPYLATIDLSEANISAYSGYNGTYYSGSNMTYPVNTVPTYAFSGTSVASGKRSLTSIVFPNTLTSIGDEAFYGCESLVGTLTFPSTLTSIGRMAFIYCIKLTSIIIPESVTSIESSAFSGNTGLISVNSNNPIYSSADGVLFNKTLSLLINCPTSKSDSYSIPNTVKIIGEHAFENCNLLNIITIPSSVDTIQEFAFWNCSGLISLNIPTSVTYIADYAFVNCKKLPSINIPSSIKTIQDGTFYGCDNLVSVDIPQSITSIGVASFYECLKLKDITIPKAVTSIGRLAFKGCKSLDSINIPDYVAKIGTSAFYDCTGLKAIYASPVFPIDISSSITVFGNVDTVNCILHVGAGSVSEYRAANQWKAFNIMEAENILYYKVGVPEYNQSICVYPNPVKTSFRIKNGGDATVLVYNSIGDLVINKRVNDDELISTNNLSNGVYIVQIRSNNSMVTQSLLIENN